MVKLLMALSLVVITVSPVGAQTADVPLVARQLVRVLFIESGALDRVSEELGRYTIDMLKPEFERSLERRMTAAEEEKLLLVMARSFREVYPAPVWEAELAAVYARYFDALEMVELLRFFETPAGGKWIGLQDTLSEEAERRGERMFTERMAEFRARFVQEFLHEFGE